MITTELLNEEINNLETEFKYWVDRGYNAKKYYDVKENEYFVSVLPMTIIKDDKNFIEVK